MIILNERQQAELKGYADRGDYHGMDLSCQARTV